MNKFWSAWKNRSPLEEKFIAALESQYQEIEPLIPKEKIVAIYVGGSFVRREITSQSDIDVYVIVKETSELEDMIARTIAFNKQTRKVPITVHVYAFKELEDGKFNPGSPYGWQSGRAAPPNYLLAQLPTFEVIYGQHLELIIPSIRDEEALKGQITLMRNILKQNWETGEVKRLRFICKNVFYVVYYEGRIQSEEKLPFSRNVLLQKFENENEHILNLCDRVRKEPESYLDQKGIIFKKISDYLDFVESNYFKL